MRIVLETCTFLFKINLWYSLKKLNFLGPTIWDGESAWVGGIENDFFW